jgi:hypothetical protein
MTVNGMTGSNHCFNSNSDNSRRGENRRTDAANESTVDMIETTPTALTQPERDDPRDQAVIALRLVLGA